MRNIHFDITKVLMTMAIALVLPLFFGSAGAVDVVVQEDSIPDSLLHPRWKIQRTTPVTYDDMNQGSADLKCPENIKQEVEYNDSLNRYVLGTRMGKTWLAAPIMMDQQEYLKWSERSLMHDYFREKNSEIFQKKGKEKFDFTDMHFSLGPAEKIFGPGGIRVRTLGTAELKLGATLKSVDNPSLPIRNRNTMSIDFDEKINLNVTGTIGDKMKWNLNYNTDATFDFDAQNMKLRYDGKEDEIIKLVEAGNVTFPSNSSLIPGASSLFGIRTDMQFGRLKLQTVFSQKTSSSTSVSTSGGAQTTAFDFTAANYEENRHFFLDSYFRNNYDRWMATLPTVRTGITINRVEIWVTNKRGQTSNTRDIVAFPGLGESTGGATTPSNTANGLHSALNSAYSEARTIDQVTTTLEGQNIDGTTMEGGKTYEKIEKARLLTSSEYTLNTAMGYVSLKTQLQSDQVLAIAYEYTSGGVTYQVGEFSSDNNDVSKALFVKSLKNTDNNPRQPNWQLMMKNVYYLASSVKKDNFRLDVKYKSDTVGVYTTYLPIPIKKVKEMPLLRLIGADRLDNNNNTRTDGYFDYVEGYTVSNGRVFLPKAEPFGSALKTVLSKYITNEDSIKKYIFTELYDSTKTVAKQIAEKNKFKLVGKYKGTNANVISLGSSNVPQGSVTVTAGSQTLKEGTDYTVDYSAGEVTIINQSIIDAGTAINVSSESQSDYAMQRKTLLGLNWEYDFSKNFQISGTLQHLNEQSLTTKVTMGAEPMSNTLLGFNLHWKQESQWLTNLLNKIPLLHLKQPSNIQFNAEFAKLFSSIASGTQDNASYIDDFESATSSISLLTPTSWQLSSVPTKDNDGEFKKSYSKTDLSSGYHRARLAWYTIDPLFTRRSSSLTPSYIKGDLDLLSNHYVREVYINELYPNRDVSSYSGTSSTLSIMNLAYYPDERGPYNFTTDLTAQGKLANPKNSWGGIMKKLDTNDFEQANIEYVEFWMMDPFIYTRQDGTAQKHSGKLIINLGEVSEDILLDGKKFYESGMPVTDAEAGNVTTTQWGKVPVQNTITYAFATSEGARAKQDVGFNGLNDEEEQQWPQYQDFLNYVKANVTSAEARDSILNDPAADNYHYFRGTDWDDRRTGILERYKYINNPQGNSPDSDSRNEAYDTSYKTTPDVEDINQDYTLNEYEKYYEYTVAINPDSMQVGSNYIVDQRTVSPTLRNGTQEEVHWYQFRVPIRRGKSVGGMSDISSIRFMRVYMTEFEEPTVLRFGSLDLVRGDWRIYDQSISGASANPTATFTASSISIEENSDKKPVNYILPPGISRVTDPTQPQLTENNEEAMRIDVSNMAANDAVAVYKNTSYDMRHYNQLQMFVHANTTQTNTTQLANNELALFIRLGSDYNTNYYEYLIPLKLTPEGQYDMNSNTDKRIVWPEENMLNLTLSKLTALKKQRNKMRAQGQASYSTAYTINDSDTPKNQISIMGNPTLGEVRTIMIGVKNLSGTTKDGEVWVNELRLLEPASEGGWAAAADLNVQLSDLGSVSASGKYVSDGFGGLEQKVLERSTDKYGTYSVTTNLELGKFFPAKAKVSAPFYYSVTKSKTSPKYNPLDTDMLLDDALESAATKQEKDSIESIAVVNTVSRNLSLSNVNFGIATKKHPMPYDPANFTFSYSHSHQHTDGETTVFENTDNWRGAINYAWSPVYKPLSPFKKSIKSKSKYFDILKNIDLNWLPQSISAGTEMTRYAHELQERDLGTENSTELPVNYDSQFRWNRDFSIRWDLTKNLRMSFNSSTEAEIEENWPKDRALYATEYEAYKDSLNSWQSIKHMGKPLDYHQTFTGSYKLPLNQIPVLNWLTADASYNATYHWARGTTEEDGSTLGNTITNNRTYNLNGKIDMVKLYNQVPFLKKVNDLFNKRQTYTPKKKVTPVKDTNKKDSKNNTKKNAFVREITLAPDTAITVTHGKKTKRLAISARTEDGKLIPLKIKKLDDNKIRIVNKGDSTMKVKLQVVALEPLDDKPWYKVAQHAARFAMMLRSFSVSYRNQYAMTLPGFMPNAGDIFGQRTGGQAMAPGLAFAFGLTSDDFINKAQANNWLLNNDSIATPATSTSVKDIQVKMTLEPVRDLKIDLNMTHSENKAKSIQYMYAGTPTTQSGSFTMTTISIGSAFEGLGSADNGYRSASFEKFCNSLAGYQARLQARYEGAVYPTGTTYAGAKYDAAKTPVNQYSADVMVPAFLNAYTGYSGTDIFPTLASMLPNWTLKYSGLSKLPWIRDHFKSVNINHSYKSIYSVGSYSSYSTYKEFMGEGLGFITNGTTGDPTPSSMFNVSTVSINEAFSPLLGIDVTLPNNMTFKAEYRTTRVLSLSMTSIQINETTSKDWVFGFGYKINDFRFWRGRGLVASKSNKSSKQGNSKDNNNNNNQTSKQQTTKTTKKGFAHDLNLRLDLSYRKQAAITRDIATVLSSATSGNTAFKLAFSAEYAISRLLSMSFYYDRQSNTPLLSSSSYPTVTQDFGLSMKFSLTR